MNQKHSSDSPPQPCSTMDQNYENKYEQLTWNTIYRSDKQMIAQLLKNGIRPQDILKSSSSGSTNGLSLVSISAWHLLILVGIMIAPATSSTQFTVTKPIQTLNLIRGTNASIKFDHLECPPSAIPYYSLRYRSVEQPFCCKSHVPISLLSDGLKEPGQETRFSVEGFPLNTTFSVILNINDVSAQDGGMIVLVYMLLNHNEYFFLKRNIEVKVLSPPVKAKCHSIKRAVGLYKYHVVQCYAPAENGRVTISCYQASSKTPPINIYTDSNDTIWATFLLPPKIQVQCCTHFSTENITQATCDHSVFRHTKHLTTSASKNSLLTMTKDPLHVDHVLSTEAFQPTSSADLNYLSGLMPVYLQVNIVVCISLFNILK